MLTPREKSEIEIFLKSLSSDELSGLVRTTTRGRVDCYTDGDCIKAILAFERSAKDFLRHKLITAKKLAQYAYNNNLIVNECECKEDFISIILDYWSGAERNSMVCPEPAISTHPCSYSNNNPIHHSNCNSNPADVEFLYGQNFCQWFYNMLNHPDPVSQGFGPVHFNANAQMLLKHVSVGRYLENSYSNSHDVSNCILNLSKEFTFNPNISSDGLRVKSDPHGLKMVLICGTLFKGPSLCGSFEQSFGLVKDPHIVNNWKIHVTALKISELSGHSVSQVEDPALEQVAMSVLQNVKCLPYH